MTFFSVVFVFHVDLPACVAFGLSGERGSGSEKLSGHVQSPGVCTGLRLPSRCRLSKEGADPGDLSLLPLGERGPLRSRCFRVKWSVVCSFL